MPPQYGPIMPECFLRSFILLPNSGSSSWQPNNEDPTAAVYNSHVDVTFGESKIYDLPPYNKMAPTTHYTYLRSLSTVNNATTSVTVGICHQGSPTTSGTANYTTDLNSPYLLNLLNNSTSGCGTPLSYNRYIQFHSSPNLYGCTENLNPSNGSSLPNYMYQEQLSAAGSKTGFDNYYLNININCPATITGSGIYNVVYYGDTVCFILTTNPFEGYMDSSGTMEGTNLSNPDTKFSCSSPLEAKPYVQVFGGDVTSGAVSDQIDVCFGDSTNSLNGSIYALNNGPTTYTGSGTDLAAIAQKNIIGFVSAQNPNPPGQSTGPPTGLTFANTNPKNLYGGDFADQSQGCPNSADGYYDQLSSQGGPVQTNNPTSLPTTSKINKAFTLLAAGIPGNYYWQVDGGTIKQPVPKQPVPKQPVTIYPGQHVVLYVNGPVLIDDNIEYKMNPGDTNIADLPSLMIITNRHNIGIANTATEVDGIYVAEDGTIIDCANTNLPITPIYSQDRFFDARHHIISNDSVIQQTCSQQLLIRGSFIANTVDLYRTHGSIHDAQSTDSAGNSQAAEEFDFSPLEWLIPNQAQDLTPQQQVPLVQSITSLPPVL